MGKILAFSSDTRTLFLVFLTSIVLDTISRDYVYSELINPVFTINGKQIKVAVSVMYLDGQSKMTQISQYNLTLEKRENWVIIEPNKV